MKSLALIVFLSASIISINSLADDQCRFSSALMGEQQVVPVSTKTQGKQYRFFSTLTGEQQVVPVSTDTRGSAMIIANPDCSEISFDLRIEDAKGVFADPGAHIHCGKKGENGPVIAFLAGGMPGGLNGNVVVRGVLTMDNIVSDACGDNFDDILVSMIHGKAYVNVHSTDYPDGEIRGQIHCNE